MKGKPLNIILFITLFVIWGMIIFRFLSNGDMDDEIYLPETNTITSKIVLAEDDYIVDGNYRDPFLGRRSHSYLAPNKPTPVTSIQKKPKNLKPPLAIVPTDWSFIVYRGEFKTKKHDGMVGLVEINKKDRIVKEGDILDQVTFKKIYKDSIQVTFKNETTYIYKANHP